MKAYHISFDTTLSNSCKLIVIGMQKYNKNGKKIKRKRKKIYL